MRQKRSKKPTNKEMLKALLDQQYRLIALQSQLDSLMEIFSDFLDFTNKKPKFMEYLEKKVEKANPGSTEDPKVEQKKLEAV